MKRRGPRVVAAMLLSALLIPGCSAPASQAPQTAAVTVSTRPGSGDSIADRVYRAVAPRIGEPTGFTTSLERVKVVPGRKSGYLIERVMDAVASRPEWVLAANPLRTTTRGTQLARAFTFKDGSVLRLIGCPIGRLGERSKFQTADVTRSDGPGFGETIADLVYNHAEPRVGEIMGPEPRESLSGLMMTAYDRLMQAALDEPAGWALAQAPAVGSRGSQRTVRFTYLDGSALVLVGIPWAPEARMRNKQWMLDAVEVTRPETLSPAGQ